MDYRCPVCKTNIAKRRFSQSILLGLETECPHCRSVVRYNLHRIESIIVMINFGALIMLAALAYWLQSRDLVLIAVGVAMVGAGALPVLEHTYLRTWPRYAALGPKPKP